MKYILSYVLIPEIQKSGLFPELLIPFAISDIDKPWDFISFLSEPARLVSPFARG